MKDAFTVITEILESIGMNKVEINHLLARFLEEELFDYVDFMETEIRKEMAEDKKTHLYS